MALSVEDPLLGAKPSWCSRMGSAFSRYAGKAGAVAAAVVAVPLAALGGMMLYRSYTESLLVWGESGTEDPHLGGAAYNRVGGLDTLLQSCKYIAFPAGYWAGQRMKGSTIGKVIMGTAAVAGVVLDVTGNFIGAATINGLKEESNNWLHGGNDALLETDSNGLASFNQEAILLFTSILARSAAGALQSFALGLGVGRR